MVVCPVCEHAQEVGSECAVCGRSLAAAGAPDPAVERVQDLEPTLLEPSPGFAVPRLDGLEPTLQSDPGPAAAAAEEMAAWMERTALAASDESALDPFAPSLCRYCRTPAAPGEVFCARCGLRLAVYRAEAPAPPDEARRCRTCGFSSRGGTCPACGGRSFADG